MKYLYYPGCSLKGSGKAYEESLLAVFRALGVPLAELDDWNCCGATAYMSVEETKSYALAARNLAIAEREGLDVIAPCSACYLVLNKTQHALQENAGIRSRVSGALGAAGLSYQGHVRVRHPLDVLINDIGLDAVKKKIVNPLKGRRFAPYYGCQLVRPYSTFDDPVNPVTMDKLVAAAGAECVEYPLKTRCCGGSLTGTVPEVGQRLSYILIKEAMKRKAEAIVTVCPLCQFNLDGYQDQISSRFSEVRLPIVYFTQVLGLAMGLPSGQLGIHRGIIDAGAVLTAR
ncbi:MAG TPA: disulfide reductase [Elusimicrobia bacterium]|nr:disulfide reductase [Elusimicrobiota bacterium]